jgi:predicted Zn-dependent peptidase
LADRYFQHTFPNGLTLLAEHMPGMQSVAMTLLVSAGASTDPVDRSGSSTVLSDLVLRGAGERDSRQLTDYLDFLGLQRSSSVGVFHTRFGCAGLGPKVIEGLATFADIVRRPHLPEVGFEAGRDLALQSLQGVEDEPRQKLMIKLREWHFPSPYGRNTMGRTEDLEKLTLDLVKADHARRYHAGDAILSLAGNVDFNEMRDLTDKLFGDWKGSPAGAVEVMPPPGRFHHEVQQSDRNCLAIATGDRSGVLRRADGVRSSQWRHERPAFHGDSRKARIMLQRFGGIQQPQGLGQHHGLRRHKQ